MAELLGRYYRLLLEWNRRINLTAVTDPREAAIKLFVDSLCVLPHVKRAGMLLDVGSGAGFPGLVLKIAAPELTVHLVESVRKKVSFQQQVILELGLKGAHTHCARLGEHLIPGLPLRAFDTVVFRAVGSLRDLVGLALPYLAPAGVIAAMKGPAVRDELSAIPVPEAEVDRVFRYRLPLVGHERTIVLLRQRPEPTDDDVSRESGLDG